MVRSNRGRDTGRDSSVLVAISSLPADVEQTAVGAWERKRVGWQIMVVPPEPTLFAGTIQDNTRSFFLLQTFSVLTRNAKPCRAWATEAGSAVSSLVPCCDMINHSPCAQVAFRAMFCF